MKCPEDSELGSSRSSRVRLFLSSAGLRRRLRVASIGVAFGAVITAIAAGALVGGQRDVDAIWSATEVSAGGATRPALRGAVDVLRFSGAGAGVRRVETSSPDVYPSLQSAHPPAEPKVKLDWARARTTENAPPIARLPLGRPAALEEATPMADSNSTQPPEVAPSSPVRNTAAGPSEGLSDTAAVGEPSHAAGVSNKKPHKIARAQNRHRKEASVRAAAARRAAYSGYARFDGGYAHPYWAWSW
jgi:hypothetical protein